MTQWYSKDLGDGVDALAPTNKIQEAFLPAFIAAGQPVEMAVLSRYDLEANIVTVYFSPKAASLANSFGAKPCEKPKKTSGLGLLVGDQGCLKLFYPAAK